MKFLQLGTESRKVGVFIPIFCASLALVYFGKITGADWIGLMEWGFGALAAGLTAEHFSGTTK